MVNFSKISVQICRSTEIYYLFADIYFANLMIISKFASDKENNNIKKNTTMANKYSGTQTEKNLAAAFAGESQARNKYTYFASRAKKDGFEQIASIFQQTADNEKEHAKMWFKEISGLRNTAENLEAAAEDEN